MNLGSIYILSIFALATGERSFTIDSGHNTFLKDGIPFRYISGSIHYFRIPANYWQDRLSKASAGGLDAIQFYVPWNLHEIEPGSFDFSGERNISVFLQAIQEQGLLAILRPGPYICAEWDFGGFPPWLIRENVTRGLRSSDPLYLKFVRRWWSVLLPLLRPFLYSNGGPIIMIQIENEYGSYYTCDRAYLQFLHSLVRTFLGDDVVVFTTDGNSAIDVACGSLVPFAYPTVDFGTGIEPHVAFAPQRQFAPLGPLVNSEFYPGWMDNWGWPHQTVPTERVVDALRAMLDIGANVNMYMYHGGTNFGYNNGADPASFHPQTTSYDYDAPLSEPGDTTHKYWAIRELLAHYKRLPPAPVPPNSSKAAYGRVELAHRLTLPEYLRAAAALAPAPPIPASAQGPAFVDSALPRSMESLGLWRGFLLYQWPAPAPGSQSPSQPPPPQSAGRTPLSVALPLRGALWITGVRDRAYVFDQNWALLECVRTRLRVGILDRQTAEWTLLLTASMGVRGLNVVLENQGHLNFGAEMMFEGKGIVSNVTLNGEALVGWRHTPIDVQRACSMAAAAPERATRSLSSARSRSRAPPPARARAPASRQLLPEQLDVADEDRNDAHVVDAPSALRYEDAITTASSFTPAFYSGALSIEDAPEDTFVDTSGWGHGVLLVAGRTLGRHWPLAGPQRTLYLPAPWLARGRNELCVFELERSPPAPTLSLIDTPILDAPVSRPVAAARTKSAHNLHLQAQEVHSRRHL